MHHLETSGRIEDVDAIYNELVEAHRGLDPEESLRLQARLLLLLINHIGDPAVVREALAIAREGFEAESGPASR